ncbi:E3 ubiquitin-protein ligase SIAH1-like isoform X1 [Pieris napi]|uniref:E3 ubiquitin-protein ligase SIAH1-like isoform X1 n=2 Tax=Pieris napi TaxID=78633 RepID=UPI001FBB542C|nr:E3 ubiquitin-protein ligase SIAH1-like isoform X1 [Pieris napi]
MRLNMEAPECPVCIQPMTVPIFQCQSGHSLCNSCTVKLSPPICPICRQTMTQMRNWQLEDLVGKAIVACPNKNKGCVYKYVSKEMEDHVKECIFREMDCPMGKVFGTCSWSGKLKEMLNHFKDRHPGNCANITSDVTIDNISVTNDCRHFYLLQFNKQIFYLSFKIDTVQKLGYWLVQYVGTKKAARQNVYEIQMNSKQHQKRQVTYIDYCFSDSMEANEVFRQAQCAVMPLIMMGHFIDNSKITFRCLIKRAFEGKPAFKNNDQSKDSTSGQKKGPPPPNRHKSPGPHVSRAKGSGTNNTQSVGPKPGPFKKQQAHFNKK